VEFFHFSGNGEIFASLLPKTGCEEIFLLFFFVFRLKDRPKA
jgi:hypothetical protein